MYLLVLSYISRSLEDRWDTTVDFTTSFLHSSRFSAFQDKMFHSRPVHSLMLSSHCFLCLPLRLPPWTVPCRIVLASPDDRATCLYHFSLCLFTEVRRSSYGPMMFLILAFTSSLAVISVPFTEEFAETSHLQCLYPSFTVCCYGPSFTCIQKYGQRISLILELMVMFLSFQMTFSLVTAAVVWAILESKYFRLGSLIWYYSSQWYLKLWTISSFLSIVKSVLMPLVLFIINWVFSGLICKPYAVEASSRWFTNLISSCSCPARLSMSSAKRKFVIVLPPKLTVPSWSSSASAIILSKNMLKRVVESRHPWRTPIAVRNHSPMLLSW